MASSLMDSILGMVTPDMKQGLASRLGESPQAVQTGLGTATAATLAGMANKASDSGFLSQITGMLGGGSGQGLLSSLPSIATGGPTGGTADLVNKFLPMVFGSQQSQLTNGIAQYAGLSSASGMGILKMAVPLVLAYFAKMHSAGSLTGSSLGNLLRSEAPNVQSYLPAGLLSGSPSVLAATPTTRTEYVRPAPTPTSSTPRWLIPAAILGALLLAWLVIRSMSGPREPLQTAANVTNEAARTAANTVSNAATATTNTATRAWAALGDMMKVKLPDGQELNVPSMGVENKLVTYLNANPNGGSGGDQWFEFDRLLFDTDQATLQPASQEQLTNIAAILKAYPQVKVKIGGYTDNTGDPAANQQLSQRRADSVMSQLTALGVDQSRMTAKGYGQDNPVADNSTEEGRQKNRRIALQIEGANAT